MTRDSVESTHHCDVSARPLVQDAVGLPTVAASHAPRASLASIAVLGLSGCGGASGDGPTAADATSAISNQIGRGGVGTSGSVTPGPTVIPLTQTAAARLLQQASFGADRTQIERLQNLGHEAWLNEQFSMPRSMSHVDWLFASGFDAMTYQYSSSPMDYSVWRKFLSSPDVLRQRVVYALSQILVVSIDGVPSAWKSFAVGYYLDVLETHAFGDFRTLIEAVTLTPAMGDYLNMRGNRKANDAGRVPDENYAREVMQLFTLGLLNIQSNGMPVLRDGQPVESYVQDDVTGLARALTGWDYASGAGLDNTTPARYVMPMQHYPSRHETGEKRFLGTTIAAGTDGYSSLRRALDVLCAHPNVGPFLGRQLIQRLVTSNPSADYVARVAAAFANNGAGQRGDLAAVVRAVLTDPEATSVPTDPGAGKLIEPVLRFARWARAFKVQSPSGAWKLGNLSDPATRLGQSPLHSPSVFNFFRPGYVAPNTPLAARSLVAPELQITTETSVAGFVNVMQTVVSSATGFLGSDLTPDYSELLALGADINALAAQAEWLLAANRLSASSRATIRSALAQMPELTETQRRNRVCAAVLLTLVCPEALVQQ